MWTAIFITIDLGFGRTVLQGPPFSILRCPPLLPLHPPFFYPVWSFLLCAVSVFFLSPATREANRYGWCRVKLVSLPITSHLGSPICSKRAVSWSLWLSGLIQYKIVTPDATHMLGFTVGPKVEKNSACVVLSMDTLQHTQWVDREVSSFCFIKLRFSKHKSVVVMVCVVLYVCVWRRVCVPLSLLYFIWSELKENSNVLPWEICGR